MTGRAEPPRSTVVVAGATGFVGQALGPALRRAHRVVGLSRHRRGAGAGYDDWRTCDLFSALDAEQALEGADYAVYLVHSMMPSARLTQGSFADLDLLCADNFARAARRAGVRQIVYLGGLMPEDDALSPHLRSRLEVEHTLAGYGVPVTTLRAGLVIGAGGSSFEMLLRLVRRLPAMACPRWTRTRTQPIALEDVVALLGFCLGREECHGRTFDVGAPEVTTYLEMMALCGELLGLRRPTLAVPLLSPRLSRLWITAVTGAPRALVAPLIESLRHEMLVREPTLQRLAGRPGIPVREALRRALAQTPAPGERPLAFRGAGRLRQESRVRSIQRMRLPAGTDARWAVAAYLAWLPRFLRCFLRARVDGAGNCEFFWRGGKRPLLRLEHAPDRSAADRQLFYVAGGTLTRAGSRGRFELRQVLGGRTLITAIHDYRPRLPWPIYAATQAPFHAWVMRAFARHLGKVGLPPGPAGREDAASEHRETPR